MRPAPQEAASRQPEAAPGVKSLHGDLPPDGRSAHGGSLVRSQANNRNGRTQEANS